MQKSGFLYQDLRIWPRIRARNVVVLELHPFSEQGAPAGHAREGLRNGKLRSKRSLSEVSAPPPSSGPLSWCQPPTPIVSLPHLSHTRFLHLLLVRKEALIQTVVKWLIQIKSSKSPKSCILNTGCEIYPWKWSSNITISKLSLYDYVNCFQLGPPSCSIMSASRTCHIL